MTRRLLICLILLSTLFLWGVVNLPFPYSNVLLTAVEKMPDEECLAVLRQRAGQISAIATFSFLGEQEIYQGERSRSQKVEVYAVNDEYISSFCVPLLSGTLNAGGTAEAVLSYDTAVNLFSNADCIDEIVQVGGQQYSITGVEKQKNGLLEKLSYGNAQYCLTTDASASQGGLVLAIASADCDAGIAASMIENYFQNECGMSVQVISAAKSAQMIRFRAGMMLYCVCLCYLFYLYRQSSYLKAHHARMIKEALSEYYIKEGAGKALRSFLFFFLFYAFFITLVFLLPRILGVPPFPYDSLYPQSLEIQALQAAAQKAIVYLNGASAPRHPITAYFEWVSRFASLTGGICVASSMLLLIEGRRQNARR